MSSLADNSSEVEPEAVDSTYATMNGHSWSSLVTNKGSPIEFYFASDARYGSKEGLILFHCRLQNVICTVTYIHA